jgi:hypothetical protein
MDMVRQLADPAALEVEIAHLRGLDLAGLRARWRSTFRRKAPEHMPRHLLFRILAYHLQADRLGDLDRDTQRFLDRIASSTDAGSKVTAAREQEKRDTLRPGTTLVREWNGARQHVMVLADGFTWDGMTYRSLSEVAYAITGTRWSGPRFFGMRDRAKGAA